MTKDFRLYNRKTSIYINRNSLVNIAQEAALEAIQTSRGCAFIGRSQDWQGRVRQVAAPKALRLRRLGHLDGREVVRA